MLSKTCFWKISGIYPSIYSVNMKINTLQIVQVYSYTLVQQNAIYQITKTFVHIRMKKRALFLSVIDQM